MTRLHSVLVAAALATAFSASGCESDAPPRRTTATTATRVRAKRKRAAPVRLDIDSSSARVELTWGAPQAKVHGRVVDAVTGQMEIDPRDLGKSTGVVRVDLAALELYRRNAAGEETKDEAQQERARRWLEFAIDAAMSPEQRSLAEEHRIVEFVIDSVDAVTGNDLTTLKGEKRRATLTVSGELSLHHIKVHKTAEVEAEFTFDGDELVAVALKTLEPLSVLPRDHGLAAPDDPAEKPLEARDDVGEEALVTIALTARFTGASAGASSTSAAFSSISPGLSDTEATTPARPSSASAPDSASTTPRSP